MNKVSFEVSQIGSANNLERQGSLADLLLCIPGLHLSIKKVEVVPPIEVLNEILASGGVDDGMSGGCWWQPFEMNKEEYLLLKKDISKKLSVEIQQDPELDSATTYKQWSHLVLKKFKSK